MNFSYEQYLSHATLVPIITILFLIFLIISMIDYKNVIPFFKKIMKREKIIWNKIGTKVFICFCITPLLIMSIRALSQGGMDLIFENPEQRMETTGTIQNITLLDSSSGYKFPTDNGASFGVKLTIDDCHYTVISIDDLQIGDCVLLEYLPESKYVLTIQKIE